MANSIGETIDEMHILRAKKRALEDMVKEIEKQYASKEAELMSLMDSQHTRTSEGKLASVHIDEVVYPTADNWDETYKFIHDNKYYHLLERRLTAVAYRELLERGIQVPGVVPFKKRKVKLTSI